MARIFSILCQCTLVQKAKQWKIISIIDALNALIYNHDKLPLNYHNNILYTIIHIPYNSGQNQNKQNSNVMKQNTIKSHRMHTQTIVMFSCKDKI